MKKVEAATLSGLPASHARADLCRDMLTNVPTDRADALLPLMNNFVRNGARKRKQTTPRPLAGVVIRSALKAPTLGKARPFLRTYEGQV